MDGTKGCLPLLTAKLPGSVSRSSVGPERNTVFASSDSLPPGHQGLGVVVLERCTETLKTTWVGDNLDTAAELALGSSVGLV